MNEPSVRQDILYLGIHTKGVAMENKMRNLSLIGDARYFANNKETHKAVAIYENLLLLTPDNLTALYDLGRLYRKEERYFEAIECFKKAVQHPVEQDTLYACRMELAVCYEKLAKEDPEHYTKAAKKYRKDASRHLRRKLKESAYFSAYPAAGEESDLHRGLTVEMEEDFKAYAAYAEMLVESYTDAGAYEKAKALCLVLLEHTPGEVYYMYLLAYIYVMLEKYREAISLYERMILFEKDVHTKALYYYEIGDCYNELGHYKKTTAAYKKALQFELNTEIAASLWNDLADVYGKRGKRKRALTCVRKALAIDPDNIYFIDTLAQTYAGMKEYSKALRCYRKIAKIDDTFAEVKEKIVEMEQLCVGEGKCEKFTAGKRR